MQFKKFFEQMPVDEPLDDLGRTTLMCFASSLNHAGMKLMIELGASLSSTDKTGRTVLHYLVQTDVDQDQTPWVLSLGKKDLDVNAATRGGETPLMLASKLNRDSIISELLNAGANPFLKNCLGEDAMNY